MGIYTINWTEPIHRILPKNIDITTVTQKQLDNVADMIHRILPKNIDITTVTQKQLDNVADILNNMPRKIFGYKTPNEIWAENL